MHFIASLLEDHAKLAALEWRFERALLGRRLGVFIGAALLCFTTFVLAQLAIFSGLLRLGWSIAGTAAALAMGDALLAAGIIWGYGRRMPRAGRPFQGTFEELHHTLTWIQKTFL